MIPGEHHPEIPGAGGNHLRGVALDLIRDWKPFGLGHADDIIILGIAVWLFWILCPLAAVREHMGEPPPPRPEDRDPDGVVDGQARPPDDTD